MKIIIGLVLGLLFITPAMADGYSTLPGWSLGYRYHFDINDNEKDKLRLFGKYKQMSGNVIKFGVDVRHRSDSKDGVLFFEQEWKF